MSDDDLIVRLVGGLAPVRRRSPRRDAALIGAVVAVELALFLLLGRMRPDMPVAMGHMGFWWKLVSLALIALGSGAVAILSLDPARSPRRGVRLVLCLILSCLLAGWLVDAAHAGWPALWVRLDWRQGLVCVVKMVLLSIPPLLGMGALVRRGASTDRSRTAWMAGVAAAAWGAFVFVFACPVDDPLYVAVWYLCGCGLVAAAARAVLPLVSRW